MRILATVSILALVSCAERPDLYLRPATEVQAPVVLSDPPPPQVRVMAGKAKDGRSPAVLLAQARRQSLVAPKAGDFVDAVQRAEYQTGRVYQVVTNPMAATVIRLGLGERILSIATGDTESWRLTTTEQDGRPVIMITPAYDDALGGFSIITSHRIYLLQVTTDPRAFTSMIEWRYPDERASQVMAGLPPIDLAPQGPRSPYRVRTVSGTEPAWKPSEAWSDGDRTVIRLGDASQVPGLFVGEGDGIGLVQYRRSGPYLITTRRVDKAELRLGQDVVRLTSERVADAAR